MKYNSEDNLKVLNERIEELKKINEKFSDEIDEAKHCQYCYYGYSGRFYNAETCRKCCHKTNFKRIVDADLK